MIRKLVDFALTNRFVVIALAILILFAGALAFHEMPVEAYPDIADNYQSVARAFRGGGRAASQHSH
jgi:cobalt-zinc-cadmium resistance protein CzcA